jgi:putative spermidine/putrescine transport system permease protein
MLAFLMVTFLAPIARMLYRSVEDPEMAIALPATAKLLRSWNGQGLPPETVFQSLAEEMPKAADARTLAALAQRLNHDVSGMRSLVLTTARTISRLPSADRAEALKNSDSRWQDPVTWAALRRAAFPITDFHLLTALDLDHDAEGRIVAMPPEESVFLRVMARTLAIGLSVTALCLVLGFPVAYLLARLPSGTSNLLMIFVLLPFWTSLLVRTSAWIVLLQNEGIVNGLLLAAGLVDQPVQMIFNRFGVYVAMTHVLLPFMILPLYSVMKGISPLTQRAAASLGAPPAVAFVRVYLPQTLPGVAAGCLLVFILALGYYITPALVGGADDQMISAFIAFYTIRSVNWGLAAALAALLLLGTLVLYAVYSRFARAGGVRLG